VVAQAHLTAPVTVMPDSTVTVPLADATWSQPAGEAQLAFFRAEFSARPERCSPNDLYAGVGATVGDVSLGVTIGGSDSPFPTPSSGTAYAALAPPQTTQSRTATASLTNPCEGVGESFTLSSLTLDVVAIR
jgi:hypothetical protein